jgi:hypothetical protein
MYNYLKKLEQNYLLNFILAPWAILCYMVTARSSYGIGLDEFDIARKT